MKGPLGRKTPSDFDHIAKYPYRSIAPQTVKTVEKVLKLPWWHWEWNQGTEGACVGFGVSMMMSIKNEAQARASKMPPYVHEYNARWLWNEAKRIDEWPDTNPGDNEGTSVRAGCDVLRVLGHVRVIRKVDKPADIAEGIKANRWATTVDEIRTCLADNTPVALGINWYSNFDKPKTYGDQWFIGRDKDLGFIRGGHCVCIYGASDIRQAVKIKNSWGKNYPLVWMPYATLGRLLQEQGEGALITDR